MVNKYKYDITKYVHEVGGRELKKEASELNSWYDLEENLHKNYGDNNHSDNN